MIKFFAQIPHKIPKFDNKNDDEIAKYKMINILKIFMGQK